ncbi:MAG: PIN domain-containing protein [Clostridiales bacterium]|jgi:predicted nucleic acid-binding protein|nr:PIN domain-containing protein [Clostridiales bacterium]
MKILLDTNIAMDIITKREGYEDSLMLLRHCELGNLNGFVSALTISDLMYILRKHIAPNEVNNAVQTLLVIVDILDVLKSDVMYAFSSGIKDFEDAVQMSCASRINADYIVTKNIKDFVSGAVPAVLPINILKRI